MKYSFMNSYDGMRLIAGRKDLHGVIEECRNLSLTPEASDAYDRWAFEVFIIDPDDPNDEDGDTVCFVRNGYVYWPFGGTIGEEGFTEPSMEGKLIEIQMRQQRHDDDVMIERRANRRIG